MSKLVKPPGGWMGAPPDRESVSSLTSEEQNEAIELRPEFFDEEEQGMSLLQARVHFCHHLRLSFRWKHRVTNKDLCKLWGLTPLKISKIAAEAKRMFAASIPDKQEFLGEVIQRMDYIVSDAMNQKRVAVGEGGEVHEYPAPDHKAAIMGLDKMVGYLGVKSPDKSRSNETLSPEELVKQLNEVMEKQREGSIDTDGKPAERSKRAGVLTSGGGAPGGGEREPDYDD